MKINAPDYSREDPDRLVALARIGETRAFEELVKLNQSGLRNLLRRLSNDPVLADDLAQQVFLETWRGIKNLRSAEAFGGWLRSVAINTWLKHLRKKDPLNRVEDVPEIPEEMEYSGIDEEIDLDRALATLPETERLCIVLAFHQGMSHSMIAEHTGMPIGTIKSHIRRGTQRLQELLKPYK